MLGERFRDVSPGRLPRTLDEMRAGHERSNADQRQHVEVVREDLPDGPSIEDALDLMIESADAEETPPNPPVPAAVDRPIIPQPVRVSGNVMRPSPSRNPEYQARRIAALRRELLRMRNGIERVISGLRDLGEPVPDSTEASTRLTDLGRSLDAMSLSHSSRSSHTEPSSRESRAPIIGSIYRMPDANAQQRFDEAQRQLEQAQRFRDQSATQFQLAQSSHNEAADVLEGAERDLTEHREQVSRTRRELRTAENYARLFGSREDMENQGADYESPIGGMFTRAWDRFRVAEEVRQETRTLREVLEHEQTATGHMFDNDAEEANPAANTVHENNLNEYYAMLRQQDWTQANSAMPDSGVSNGAIPEEAARTAQGTQQDAPRPMTTLERLLRNTPEPQRSSIIARMTENGTAQALQVANDATYIDVWRRLRDANAPFRGNWEEDSESDDEDRGTGGLDAEDTGRPEPKDDNEMTLKLDCKVCYTQTADTACLPCGHLVMCQWCSEQHSPVMQHDRTRPRRPANCPVCRKKIKQKVRIYRA